jgi:hypothetical protein
MKTPALQDICTDISGRIIKTFVVGKICGWQKGYRQAVGKEK